MSASASLIPELEHVIQHGSQNKRAATVKRIATLFVDGAPHFNEDHIGLFDDVLCRLVVEIEAKARAEMAQTLAPVGNAPAELMRTLARDDDIDVAGPVIAKSARLREDELVELARTKGQAHLAVIAGRKNIRHLFFGHLHRPVAGSWRGIPISTLRATSHQVALDFVIEGRIPGSHEPPAYGVCLLEEDQMIVHMHDFLDRTNTFLL